MPTEQALVFAWCKAGSPAITNTRVSPKPMGSDVNKHALEFQVQSQTATAHFIRLTRISSYPHLGILKHIDIVITGHCLSTF